MAAIPKYPTTSAEKAPAASEPMSTYVPTVVGDCIREDAAADERSESFVIARILKRHYADRIKKRAAQPLRDALASQRRAA